MVTVAVIDNGINTSFLPANVVISSIAITEELKMDFYDTPCLQNSISHGTFCAGIIHKYAPDASIISIKITNEKTKKSSRAQLIRALEWCSENNIHLVNLSMGTVDYRDFEQIKQVVLNCAKKGMILVAAHNNYDIYTIPASLPYVIGVRSCVDGVLLNNQFCCDNADLSDGSNFIAPCCFDLDNFFKDVHYTPCSNSFAAPIITANICNLFNTYPNLTFDKVKHLLKSNSLDFPGTNIIAHRSLPESEFIMPLIAVCSEIPDAEFLAQGLEQKFLEDGYNLLLFTDMKTGGNKTVIPLEYVSANEKCNISLETLSVINFVYKADIVIVSLHEKTNRKTAVNLPFDMIFHEVSEFSLNRIDCFNCNQYIFDKGAASNNCSDRVLQSIEEVYGKILDNYHVAQD